MARFPIAPPPYTPSPNGLLDVATDATPADGDPHWQVAGVEWEPACYPPAGLTSFGCLDDGTLTTVNPSKIELDEDDAPTNLLGWDALHNAPPFTVFVAYRCSTSGRVTASHEQRAIEALNRGDTRTVEAVFQRGGPTVDGSLGPVPGSLLATATPVGVAGRVANVIGTLEATHGTAVGGLGVLHLNRLAVTLAQEAGLLYRDGPRLRTVIGTPVVIGTGYHVDADPEEPVPAYITGPVLFARSTPEVVGRESERINRDNNDTTIFAERTFLVASECESFVGLIDPLAEVPA